MIKYTYKKSHDKPSKLLSITSVPRNLLFLEVVSCKALILKNSSSSCTELSSYSFTHWPYFYPSVVIQNKSCLFHLSPTDISVNFPLPFLQPFSSLGFLQSLLSIFRIVLPFAYNPCFPRSLQWLISSHCSGFISNAIYS